MVLPSGCETEIEPLRIFRPPTPRLAPWVRSVEDGGGASRRPRPADASSPDLGQYPAHLLWPPMATNGARCRSHDLMGSSWAQRMRGSTGGNKMGWSDAAVGCPVK